MKNYNSITQAYLLSRGLVRVWVRDAATDAEVLIQVTPDKAQKLKRSGRVVR